MLVLTRNIGEKIIIGKRLVTLTVLELSDKSVSIGIDADKTISIHREEIYDRIERGEKMEGNK